MARPSKGQRVRYSVRVPLALAEALHAEASRRGLTVNDYLLWAIRKTIDASHLERGRGEQR